MLAWEVLLGFGPREKQALVPMRKCVMQCVFRSRTDRIEPEYFLSADPLPIKLASSSDTPKEAEVNPLVPVQPTLYNAGDGEAPPPTSLTGHLARDPSAEQSATAQLTGHCPWDSLISVLTFPIPLGDKARKVKLKP